MNVESIESVGLMKPIRVNDKFLETTGHYELICGEGRLNATPILPANLTNSNRIQDTK